MRINGINRENLARLATYLKSLPADTPKFQMDRYANNARGDEVPPYSLKEEMECGTAACAAGYGPMAGIAPRQREGWNEYITRTLIDTSLGHAFAWRWCFSCDWADIDNTPHGAAARIEYFLENGVPANMEEQINGLEELCYVVEP